MGVEFPERLDGIRHRGRVNPSNTDALGDRDNRDVFDILPTHPETVYLRRVWKLGEPSSPRS
jgi:hypothetical protein